MTKQNSGSQSFLLQNKTQRPSVSEEQTPAGPLLCAHSTVHAGATGGRRTWHCAPGLTLAGEAVRSSEDVGQRTGPGALITEAVPATPLHEALLVCIYVDMANI